MANYGKYYMAVRLLLLKQYLEANAGSNRIVKRRELEDLLREHEIFLKTVHESFLSWEAHPHFLHQNKAQNEKTGSTS